MHVELRVRTLCELVLNENFYLQPSIVSIFDPYGKQISKNALIATSANFDRAVGNLDADVAKTVLQMDCLETTKSGQYSNMWHIHGLASALGRSITSIYPEKNDRVRPLIHKEVHPRIALQDGLPLIIMWTRAAQTSKRESSWTPNHFVPCYDPTESLHLSSACNNHPSSSSQSIQHHNLTLSNSIQSPLDSSQLNTLQNVGINDKCLELHCNILPTPSATTKKDSESLSSNDPNNSKQCTIPPQPLIEFTKFGSAGRKQESTCSSLSNLDLKANAPLPTSTMFTILTDLKDARLSVGKRRTKVPKSHPIPVSSSLLKFVTSSKVTPVSEPAVTTTLSHKNVVSKDVVTQTATSASSAYKCEASLHPPYQSTPSLPCTTFPRSDPMTSCMETPCDISVNEIFNLFSSGPIQVHKQKCKQPSISKSSLMTPSLTTWLAKSCDDKAPAPAADLSVYETEFNFEFQGLNPVPYNTTRQYSLTVDVSSVTEPDSSSESDLSGASYYDDDGNVGGDSDDVTEDWSAYYYDDENVSKGSDDITEDWSGASYYYDDETVSEDSDDITEEVDFDPSVVHIHVQEEKSNPLPFPKLSSHWYERQLYTGNKEYHQTKS